MGAPRCGAAAAGSGCATATDAQSPAAVDLKNRARRTPRDRPDQETLTISRLSSNLRRPLVACLAVFAALALAPAAGAADQLVFQCAYDLCLINPDSPLERSNLTNTSAGEESLPRWSPLGNLIAYAGDYRAPGNETTDIYTLDPAEAAPREPIDISDTPKGNEGFQFPVWSPDGSRVAFYARPLGDSDPLKAEAYIGRADGTYTFAIASSPANEGAPTFSPDGNTVALVREGVIYTTPADGSGPLTTLPLEPRSTNWSPDGRYMIGERLDHYPYGAVVTDVDGSGERELAKPSSLGTYYDWSCDSKRVAFVADEVSKIDQVWVAPVDGSSPGVPIPLPSGWYPGSHADPTFSPDGTRVAFSALPISSGTPGPNIFVAPADGSAVATQITFDYSNYEPDWKPGATCATGAGGGGGPTTGPGTQPGTGQPGAGGGAQGSGGGSTGGRGSNPPGTKTPVKVKLAYFNHPKLLLPGHMVLAGVDCNAQGGHPTGAVAEICAANAKAYAGGSGALSGIGHALTTTSQQKVLFAAGAVKVPEGKKKALKLKLTAVGKKLLRPGSTLKLTVQVGSSRGGESTKTTKVVSLKVPPEHPPAAGAPKGKPSRRSAR